MRSNVFPSNSQKYGDTAKFEDMSQKRNAENPIHYIIIIIQFISTLFYIIYVLAEQPEGQLQRQQGT